MENLVKVDKHTRASREGRLIFCPDCFNSKTIYHFAWAGLWCSNKECDFSYEKSPNFSIPKNMWLVTKKINSNGNKY